jgi:glutamate-5-semialdehyde dehydrogenase
MNDHVAIPGIATIGEQARAAARHLARTPADARDTGLREMAAAIRRQAAQIAAANADDLAGCTGNAAFRDRLALTPPRIEAMAEGLERLAELPDPLGRTLAEWTRPNELHIRRVAAPIGVIGMIYESRPNVGADAAGICLKSGNSVILRGGSESFASAGAIGAAMLEGLARAGLPAACVQMAPDTGRGFVSEMLGAAGLIDLLIPRGGRSLVTRVQAEARMPVLAHADGLCHTYVHAAASPEMARAILANAKMRRTGICGATETLLIDSAIAPGLLPLLVSDLAALGCSFRADQRARAIVPGLPPASDADFATEWLDSVLSVAVVDGLDAALAHIARFGSAHTDAIVTEDEGVARAFMASTDSAVAMWNTSTQFCDGGEFGFGAEIGIATGRVHARGPVGPEQLTCFRYEVVGQGQLRG